MEITVGRSEPKQVEFSKRTKYHGSSFIYVDGEYYLQHGAYGGTPEIVSRKLDRTDKKIIADIKVNGLWKHCLSRTSDTDEDCLPFY